MNMYRRHALPLFLGIIITILLTTVFLIPMLVPRVTISNQKKSVTLVLAKSAFTRWWVDHASTSITRQTDGTYVLFDEAQTLRVTVQQPADIVWIMNGVVVDVSLDVLQDDSPVPVDAYMVLPKDAAQLLGFEKNTRIR
jgi:hypothetical protein